MNRLKLIRNDSHGLSEPRASATDLIECVARSNNGPAPLRSRLGLEVRAVRFIQNTTLMLILFATGITYAAPASVTQTKQSLSELQTKIRLLQQHLNQVKDKQTFIKQALSNTEKQINQESAKLRQVRENIVAKEKEIKALQPEITALNDKRTQIQSQLMQSVRALYEISENQPVTWFLTQDSQYIDKLLVYNQYIVRSNKQLLETLETIQQALSKKETALNQDMHQLQALQRQLEQNQRKLSETKQYHTVLLRQLTDDIDNKQQTLASYRQSQANLTKLLTSLAQQSVLQSRHPLTQMKRKLLNPVNTSRMDTRKVKQGILFDAPEGAPVVAVSPGKVVFADWLNGYGNLLIIDHGWGFMSLYANNMALLKQKGNTVNQGEQIAKVGHSGALRENGLYFEIRHRGKAIPPLEWLK